MADKPAPKTGDKPNPQQDTSMGVLFTYHKITFDAKGAVELPVCVTCAAHNSLGAPKDVYLEWDTQPWSHGAVQITRGRKLPVFVKPVWSGDLRVSLRDSVPSGDNGQDILRDDTARVVVTVPGVMEGRLVAVYEAS